MVGFKIVKGRKGEEDWIVLVKADWEALSFQHLLFILDSCFKTEDSAYPRPKYRGRIMLMQAVLELAMGQPIEKILKLYRLEPSGLVVETHTEQTTKGPLGVIAQ